MNRFLQALIAISGLAITGLLTWQTLEEDRRQTRTALLQLFSEQINVALQTCSPDPLLIATDTLDQLVELGGSGREVEQAKNYQDHLTNITTRVESCTEKAQVAAAVEEQAGPEIVAGAAPPPEAAVQQAPINRSIIQAPPQITANVDPGLIRQQTTVSDNFGLRRAESSFSKIVRTAPDERRWFAVLASYKVGEAEEPAAEHYRKYREVIGGQANLEVYRTQKSNHYAIVLHPENYDRDKARELVAMAREKGWSPDSFVQYGQDWTRCEPADTAAALAACGSQSAPAK